MDKNKPRVLFVDDEADFLATLMKRMAKRGLPVRGENDGEACLRVLEEAFFEVVVLDVRMPGMSGIELLRKIKTRWPLVEVIMLTGHASLDVAREGMRLGAFDYLIKPADFDELLYKIEDAYEKVRLQQKKMERLEKEMGKGR